MMVRRMIPVAACALIAGAALAPRLAAQTCPAAAAADTTEWRRVDAGNFSLRLPGSYHGTHGQRLDGPVRTWTAPRGRRVRSEYGSARSVGNTSPATSRRLVCDQGVGDSWRIVAYEQRGVFGIGYFGRDPSEEGRAVVLTAESPRRQDLPELLAIIHSLRWAGPPPFQPR
ncbi:MAG: hypothetical protein ACJ8GN_24840 [Longimicrobiaceae bacterium]